MSCEVLVLRTLFRKGATRGHLIVNDTHWGYTLEDQLRPAGVKVIGLTCIPAGRYELQLMPSPHFNGKILPRLHNVPNYDGVLMHGGNRPADTLACILVGAERKAWDWISKSLSDRLVATLREAGGGGYVTILNGPDAEDFLTFGLES